VTTDDSTASDDDDIVPTAADAEIQEVRKQLQHKKLLFKQFGLGQGKIRKDFVEKCKEHDAPVFEQPKSSFRTAEEFHSRMVELFENTTWQKNKRLGPEVQKVTLGCTADYAGVVYWSAFHGANISLWGPLRQLGIHLGATFTNIDIVKNTPRCIHTDSRNTGKTLIVTFGNYTGGKFQVWPGREKRGGAPDESDESIRSEVHDPHYLRPLDERTRGIFFKGEHYHSACERGGDDDRYSVVYYCKIKCKHQLGRGKQCPPSAATFARELKRKDNIISQVKEVEEGGVGEHDEAEEAEVEEDGRQPHLPHLTNAPAVSASSTRGGKDNGSGWGGGGGGSIEGGGTHGSVSSSNNVDSNLHSISSLASASCGVQAVPNKRMISLAAVNSTTLKVPSAGTVPALTTVRKISMSSSKPVQNSGMGSRASTNSKYSTACDQQGDAQVTREKHTSNGKQPKQCWNKENCHFNECPFHHPYGRKLFDDFLLDDDSAAICKHHMENGVCWWTTRYMEKHPDNPVPCKHHHPRPPHHQPPSRVEQDTKRRRITVEDHCVENGHDYHHATGRRAHTECRASKDKSGKGKGGKGKGGKGKGGKGKGGKGKGGKGKGKGCKSGKSGKGGKAKGKGGKGKGKGGKGKGS
jgi:hypothetical protein